MGPRILRAAFCCKWAQCERRKWSDLGSQLGTSCRCASTSSYVRGARARQRECAAARVRDSASAWKRECVEARVRGSAVTPRCLTFLRHAACFSLWDATITIHVLGGCMHAVAVCTCCGLPCVPLHRDAAAEHPRRWHMDEMRMRGTAREAWHVSRHCVARGCCTFGAGRVCDYAVMVIAAARLGL